MIRQLMSRCEQFEIWSLAADGRWQFAAAFVDFDVASAVASARNHGVRLLHAVYENGRVAEQNVIANLGKLREIA